MRSSSLLVAALLLLLLPSAAAGDDADLKDKALAARIEKALKRATVFLGREQRRDGSWTYDGAGNAAQLPGQRSRPNPQGSAGLTGLVMYASEVARGEPASFGRGAAWAHSNDALFGGKARWSTYSTAFLVCAHATRRSGGPHGIRMREHAARLVSSQLESGLWNYGAGAQGLDALGDRSNTQVAVLALWIAASEVDYVVPKTTWKRVREHFKSTQLKDGSWGYRAAKGRRATGKATKGSRTMTAAGLCSYLLAVAALKGGGRKGLAAARGEKVVAEALKALEAFGAPDASDPYAVWLEERVRVLLGHPANAWFAPLATRVLAAQAKNGSWRSTKVGGHGDTRGVYDTALCVLFLARASRRATTGG